VQAYKPIEANDTIFLRAEIMAVVRCIIIIIIKPSFLHFQPLCCPFSSTKNTKVLLRGFARGI
jgi:hypothetical protein